MKAEAKKLFCALFKVGCIGFGGGSALIPIIHRNIVEESKLVTEEDFNKDVAVAISTPGALPVEISVGAGSKVAGLLGFFLGPVLISLPGVLLSLIIILLLGQINNAVSRQVTFLSMGVMTYIMSVIMCYIYNTFSDIFHAHKYDVKDSCYSRSIVMPNIQLLIKRILLTIAVICLFSILVFLVFPGCASFSWKACLSSVLSFGGGDAYMAVAERLFVATGLLASYYFYSVIFPVVNATPGSILCKTLTCIGYCIGIEISSSISLGLLMAFCGYTFSICMSCITFAAGSCFLETITTLKVWKYINLSLRTAISILQLNILYKLTGELISPVLGNCLSVCLAVTLVALHLTLPKLLHIRKFYVVLVSIAVYLIVGNIES